MGRRFPEQPTWTLLLTHQGAIVAVRREYAQDKIDMGWILVAREDELLPFNPPRVITEDDEHV